LLVAIGLVFALLLAVPVLFFGWMHASRLQERDADALIILGYRCDNGRIHPLLKDRLDTAIRLLAKHRYRRVILSGGAVVSSRSEAEIMRDYLVSRAIPEERLLLEQKSRNTVHNIVNCKILMNEHGVETCLLVSNSFHIRRMKYIMSDLGISASFYASRDFMQLVRQWRITFQEIRAFRLTLPWLAKAQQLAPGEMMGTAAKAGGSNYERSAKA
jgi:uncharacterized SAM-binding protein YcdF (DUF218 family)